MDKQAEVQSGWSTVLMIGIAIMVPVYVSVSASERDDKLMIAFLFFPTLTVMQIGYLFTYRGPAHKQSRIGFVISLILTLFVLFVYAYGVGMAKAFTH